MPDLQAIETQLTDAKAQRALALQALTDSQPQLIAHLAEYLGYQREVEALEKIRVQLIAHGTAAQ